MRDLREHRLHQTAINTIRFLAVDMVEAARSGHPGTPMALAPLAYLLWTRHLRHDPADPGWFGRDRFILSCGHASALQYALLHLCGYDLPMAELRRFRQLGSKTAGHPEHGHTPGVESTTGPLGQGMGSAVGMALARRFLAARFDRSAPPLMDWRVWVIASDGDIMEGIASEASSLAGHFRLANLKVLYDDNGISIDGSTSLTFSEDVGKRYEAYGWRVERVDDGNDLEALDAALTAAEEEDERPMLVIVPTHIGYGAPNKQNTADAHGSPLGAEEVKAAKENLGWPLEPTFHVPEEARAAFAHLAGRGRELRRAWEARFQELESRDPELAAEARRWLSGELPADWRAHLPAFAPDDGPMATRSASGKVINALAPHLPMLLGGSADLSGSNNTLIRGEGTFSTADPGGRNLHFGVREHAMGAILNGMALTGVLRPYGGTFLIFSDYMRAAMRLAALMELPVIYVLTHDSIFLGEDGPTHQPVSQLLSLRAIPNMVVLRPADANETAAAWRVALERRGGPTALALTRQKLPVLEATARLAPEGVARGAYVLAEAEGGEARVILIASGSEVALALEARRRLAEQGVPARVVSMPSWELFERQDAGYRHAVLPPALRERLAIEAGTPLGWHRWVGDGGDILAVERFGASAPSKDLAEEYGFTPEEVLRRVRRLLQR